MVKPNSGQLVFCDYDKNMRYMYLLILICCAHLPMLDSEAFFSSSHSSITSHSKLVYISWSSSSWFRSSLSVEMSLSLGYLPMLAALIDPETLCTSE